MAAAAPGSVVFRLAGGLAVLIALWGYRLARFAVALLTLAALLGTGWALLIIGLAAALGFTAVLRLAAGLGLLLLWHWPWWAATIAMVPRVLLWLPGYFTALSARWRHPRPRWAPSALGVSRSPARPGS